MFTGRFAACFFTFSLLLSPVGSLEVTLYDTAKLDTLGWTSYSPGLVDRLGWREASYSKTDGSVLRVYTTCNIDFSVVNNWVRMPFLRRAEAARLYVNTKFTMRRCSGYPDPASVQLCKESFKLMYYESDDDIANSTFPSWDDDTYRSADIIAADRLFADIDNATINDITRSVAPSKNGVYFAFYDQGACMTLLSVRIYYKVCPDLTSNLTVFGRTVTGPDVTSVVQTRARCADHAASELPVYALCKADGGWMDLGLSDACRCLPGYQPDGVMKNCTECPIDTYKSWSGNGRCVSCPRNSFAPRSGSTECQCADGFNRRASDGSNASCTNSFGPVGNLTVTYTNQTFVSLWWQPPGDKPVYYSVECTSCGSSVSYIPQQFGFNTTSVSISGLEPGGTYVIKVYVTEPGFSYMDGSVTSITVTTKSTSGVPKIASVYIVRIDDDSVDLVWTVDLDPTVAAETVTGYEVNYWPVKANFTRRSVVAIYPNISVSPLEPDMLYIFQVRARSASTWSAFSNPVSAKTEAKSASVSSATFDLVAVIAGTAVGVVACVIIIVVVAMMIVYRRKKHSSEGNNSDCDMLKYINGAQSLGRIAVNQSCSSLPSTGTDSLHIYADPFAYEDPSHYTRDRICEVDSATITIDSILLTGCYGNMCVGKMTAHGAMEALVMIETLNESTSEDERIHFLSKAEIVWRLNHANVIAVKGVISKTTPHMIITEFMSNGSLKYFIKENGYRLQPNELFGMLHGIASAMAYIAGSGYILRDLSSKSILLDDRLTCKVSYFDKLLYLEEDRIQLEKVEDLLLRWSPPEVLLQNCFSVASDVWSYGVVAWEVMTFGDSPYSGLSDDQVIRTVVGGNRLPLPQNCPDFISQLLAKCWMQKPDQRPTFATVVRILESSMQDLGSLSTTTQPTHRPDVTLRPSAFAPFRRGADGASLNQWLQSLQLDFYLANFHSRGYSEIGHVLHLTEDDLEQVGVTVPSHRRLMLQSIQDLRTNASYIGNKDYYV